MKTLTPKQYAAKINAMNKELARGLWVELSARDAMSKADERIFFDGKNSGGGKIGTYSIKPIYISPDDAPRAVRNTGKTGKKIKSGYYPRGYKGFRKQQGRESSFVNLRLKGELRSDYDNGKVEPRPQKINNMAYKVALNKQINIDKKKGAEKKYGLIFKSTKAENKQFSKSLELNYQIIIDKHLGK